MGNKLYGKIKEFDGFSGIIVTQDDIYIFTESNTIVPVKPEDFVTFYGDTVLFDKKITKVARKIEPIIKENINKLTK